MHEIPKAPPLPFAVEQRGRDGGEAILGAPAAAATGAHEELPARPRDVDEAAVGTDDEVAAALVAHRERDQAGEDSRTSATPMRASRVMSGISSASPIAWLPAGRSGSTM